MNLHQVQKHIRIILLATFFVTVKVLILSPIILFVISAFLIKGAQVKLSMEKIKWTPLYVPIRRRLEVLALGVLAFNAFFLMPLVIYTTIALLFYLNNFGRLVLIACWIYSYYDHYTKYSVLDGIGWKNLRTAAWGRYGRSYFPVELVKTAELKPNKNYLMACFPHGVLSIGPTINCALDIRKWLELFPGIRPKVVTLDINLCIPFLRTYMLLYGYTSTSKESLLYYLNKSNDPNHKDNRDGFSSYALALAVGGAKEASETQPGVYTLTLKNRKGFVKIAIMSGSSIVPSFTFNEVDSFEQIFPKPGTFTYRLQHWIKDMSTIWPSMIVGRGFFQYTFGVIPYRNRLVQVVGAPIAVEKCAKPDAAYIDEIHQKVVLAVQDIFEKYKDKYLQKHKDAKLIIT